MTEMHVKSITLPCDLITFNLELIVQERNAELEGLGIYLLERHGHEMDASGPNVLLASTRRKHGKRITGDRKEQTDNYPFSGELEGYIAEMVDDQKGEMLEVSLIRDRIFGSYYPANQILNRKSSKYKVDEIEQLKGELDALTALDVAELDPLTLIRPNQRYLSNILDTDFHNVPKRVLTKSEIVCQEVLVTRQFLLRETKSGDLKWIADISRCPISRDLIRSNQSLKITQNRAASTDHGLQSTEENLQSMLKDLARTNLNTSDNSVLQKGVKLLQSIGQMCLQLNEEMNQSNSDRLEYVEPVVGTEQEQWLAAARVIESSKNDALLLSAFTNPEFAEYINQRLDDAQTGKKKPAALHLFSGEPDRVNEADYGKRTKQFAKKLQREVGTTASPSHAKVVISDTGQFWIGSCNLLSAAESSWNAEVGVLVEDPQATSQLLTQIKPWFGPRAQTIERMIATINIKEKKERAQRDYTRTIGKLLTTVSREQLLNKKNRKPFLRATLTLRKILNLLSKTPRYSFLTTEQHRSFVLEAVAQSKESVAIASDQFRPTGFDLTLQNSILARIDAANTNEKYNISIYWGRQTPRFKEKDPEIIEGTALLDNFRKAAKASMKRLKQKNWKRFLPERINGPMNNHAKFVIVDKRKVLVSSLNITGGKSEEFDALDASELGIVIDSRPLAMNILGEMNLMMPDGFSNPNPNFTSIVDWFGSIMVSTTIDLGQTCDLETLLQHFFERVMGVERLRNQWTRYMNRIDKNDSVKQAVKILKVLQNKGLVRAWNEENQEMDMQISKLHNRMKQDELNDFSQIMVSTHMLGINPQDYPLLPEQDSSSERDETKLNENNHSTFRDIRRSGRKGPFNPFAKNSHRKRD